VQAIAGLDEQRVDASAGVGIEAVGSGLFAAGDEWRAGDVVRNVAAGLAPRISSPSAASCSYQVR